MPIDKLTEWALQILNQASLDGIYGQVTFEFKAGSPVLARIEETQKPPVIAAMGAPVDARPQR